MPTPADPQQPASNPTSNPPGGGSWRWDADAQAWVPSQPAPAPQPINPSPLSDLE